MSVRLLVRPFDPSLSIALNLHRRSVSGLSFLLALFLSQVSTISLRSLFLLQSTDGA